MTDKPNPQEIQSYYKEYHLAERRHKVQRRSRQPSYYRRYLDLMDVKAGRKILDIACGTGGLLVQAKLKGLVCYGIDISPDAISVAKGHVDADLVCESAEEGLPWGNNYFDYATCLGSLEHFQNQPGVVREISRVSNDRAKICILVPNRNYILHKFGYETDYQPVINRYSLSGYRTLLESNGLTISKVLKDNYHLVNLTQSSSYLKHILKIVVHPFARFLPLGLSYNFIFLCTKRAAQ